MPLKRVTNPFGIIGRLAVQGLDTVRTRKGSRNDATSDELANWIADYAASIDSQGSPSAIAVAGIHVRVAALLNDRVNAPQGRQFDEGRLPPEIASLLEQVRRTRPTGRDKLESASTELEQRILTSRLPAEPQRRGQSPLFKRALAPRKGSAQRSR